VRGGHVEYVENCNLTMGAMLGLRLDEEIGRRLAAVARAEWQSLRFKDHGWGEEDQFWDSVAAVDDDLCHDPSG